VPKVIHINDKRTIAGGVEVYIDQLQSLLPTYGWESEWLGVSRARITFSIVDHSGSWVGNRHAFSENLRNRFSESDRILFHVHSVSDPVVIESLRALGTLVRTMHEPRLFCPGQGKFWLRTETICTRPFGLHCIWHAYSQKCCNRHPKRLVSSWLNTCYELQNASANYSKLIANSAYIKSEAVTAGIDAGSIVVVPYFTPLVENVDSFQEKRSSKKIVFTGRLSRTKGVHYLIDAFSLVFSELPDATLDIFGSGFHENEFRARAERLGLAGSLVFHGWASRYKIGEYLSRADVVAFPSIYPEAFGISGIEAMMHGKPVVAFDVGGVREWLIDGETGVIVSVKDVVSFADALVRLLSKRSERVRMGRQAHLIALERFTPERHLRILMEEIYPREKSAITSAKQ
jgi:glycosyltransferase involved in cell wall biosynthesis